ncbi:hypothetical protein TeGR_g12450 [Tetraparma gracilis]|uniref:Plastid lipid-associated protein/fibrillin conserved domain-containing protein n=1 Tax=Tetraparma gracilis TaxID=2962635 RepID=A0ABQ6N7D7_9STRA|nr:hypothetical protein TeGR_g12450 [Tetraparma gracilis]
MRLLNLLPLLLLPPPCLPLAPYPALLSAVPSPSGSKLPADIQAALAAKVDALVSTASAPPSTADELTGTHRLVYSTAPGPSSGSLGPFVGSVTQTFVDEVRFVNRVELGPLKLELSARRTAIDGKRYRVSFDDLSVSCFSLPLLAKTVGGEGVWELRFVEACEGSGGRKVRVMSTPSIFVLEEVES